MEDLWNTTMGEDDSWDATMGVFASQPGQEQEQRQATQEQAAGEEVHHDPGEDVERGHPLQESGDDQRMEDVLAQDDIWGTEEEQEA